MKKFFSLILLVAGFMIVTMASARAGHLDTIDAAVDWGNGKAYFFGSVEGYEGMYYVRYDMNNDTADDGYPKPVTDSTWPGLYLDYITAAVNWGNGKAYFFGYIDGYDGMYYVRYDIAKDRADEGYPYPVTDEYWPGLTMLTDISAALNIGDGNVYFFGYNSDISYSQLGLTYSIANDVVIEDYPQPADYNNIPGHILTDTTAAIPWDNGKFYLLGWIEGDIYPAYERFSISNMTIDDGYPRVIDQAMWPGLGPVY